MKARNGETASSFMRNSSLLRKTCNQTMIKLNAMERVMNNEFSHSGKSGKALRMDILC